MLFFFYISKKRVKNFYMCMYVFIYMQFMNKEQFMTKEEFMKRCSAIRDNSLVYWKLDRDVFMYMKHATTLHIRKLLWQKVLADDITESISHYDKQTMIKAQDVANFLAHPCQQCAEDPQTRPWRRWRCSHR
jgi:hypothetical protein